MQGIVVLAVYAVFMLGATVLFTKRTSGASEDFHVGNRRMGTAVSSLSIAATWIWAPALFVSCERAYVNGWPGLFWFLVPNTLCLIIFIPFAKRTRAKFPQGITLSAYMGKHYNSRKVQGVYQFQFTALAVLSTAVQLLAGSKMLAIITGLPFFPLTVALAVIAFSYCVFSGIKATVLTDAIQMIVMLIVSVSFVAFALRGGNGFTDVAAGLFSSSGEYKTLFDAKGIELFLAFGLPTTIGLLSGPFGDQSFWQRSFAVRKEKLGTAFFAGALLFAVVPLAMGTMGFMAAGTGFKANDTGLVNLEFISSIFPAWVIVPFLFMVLSGLLSTVSSNLCSAASLTTDYSRTSKTPHIVMAALIILAIGIANIKGLTVTHLFLFYGTLRASTLLPTVLTILGRKLKGRAVFIGILAALLLGLPIFAYGNIANIALFKTIGSLTTVLTSGVLALIISRKKGDA